MLVARLPYSRHYATDFGLPFKRLSLLDHISFCVIYCAIEFSAQYHYSIHHESKNVSRSLNFHGCLLKFFFIYHFRLHFLCVRLKPLPKLRKFTFCAPSPYLRVLWICFQGYIWWAFSFVNVIALLGFHCESWSL